MKILNKISLIAILALSLTSCKHYFFKRTTHETGTISVEDDAPASPKQQESDKNIVYFDFNKADLNEDAKKALDEQVEWLKDSAEIRVRIEGHADEKGDEKYNMALGKKRANAVKAYLTKKGVNASRVKTVSFGESRPAVMGTDEDSLTKNRRAVTVEQSK
jgi:peptidoglycan-associated lipoprotein